MPSRRTLLTMLCAGAVSLAGCGEQEPATRTDSPTATRSPTPTASPTPVETPKDTECEQRWNPGDGWSFSDGTDVTAAAAGRAGVFAATDEAVLAVESATGEPRWRTEHESVREGFGVQRLLATEGSLLVVGYQTLAALDPASGQRVWSFTVPGKEQTAGVMADAAALVGDTLYFGATNQGTASFDVDDPYSRLYAVETESGETRQVREFSSDGGLPAPRHLAGNDEGLVCSLGDRLVALRHDGEVRWRSSPVEDGYGDPPLVDETVLAPGDGGVTAFRVADGRRRWHEPELGTALDAVNGVGYAAPGDGVTTLTAFEPETADRYWEATVRTDGTAPTVADGVLFRAVEGDEAALTAFDAERGCRLGSVELAGGSWKRPVVGDGRVSIVGGEWQNYSLRSVELA